MRRHIRALTFLGEILPVLGTVGLLGLWLYQQTGIDARATELRRLSAARAVFQTYQSNNALFNAIDEIVKGNAGASNNVRIAQIHNYEQGLRAIENALPDTLKQDIPESRSPFNGDFTFEKAMPLTQKRLELLQGRLSEHETAVAAAAERSRRTYLILYLAISALSILGAVCKFIDKLTGVSV